MSDEIPEMSNENNNLKEENEASKAEKAQQNIQQNSAEPIIAIPTLQSNEEEGSSNSALEEKPTKRYRVPNWFFDSSPWIDRKGVADSSLSTASNAFKQHFWPKLHENVEPHTIERLEYHKDVLKIRHYYPDNTFIKEVIPIASIPPPDYIVGFKRIDIYYMDEKIMNFIKCSARLLQNHKITIELNQINWKTLQRWINAVHAFCLDYKIDEFILHNLNDFNQIFPGILDDHVQFVRLWVEMNNTDDFGNILNWLTKQSNTNGKQRIIDLGLQEHRAVFTQLFNRIKEEFSSSKLPCNFLVHYIDDVEDGQYVEEFMLENEETNEILTLYRKDDPMYPLYYLARYPKGEEHWKEDGENKIKEDNCNVISSPNFPHRLRHFSYSRPNLHNSISPPKL